VRIINHEIARHLLKVNRIQATFLIGFTLLGSGVAFVMITDYYETEAVLKKQFEKIDFSNIRVTAITGNSAIVIGTTSIATYCEVEYGIDGKFSNVASDSDMMDMPHTEHLVTILDLKPDTEYTYRFKAVLDGQIFYSDPNFFVTSN